MGSWSPVIWLFSNELLAARLEREGVGFDVDSVRLGSGWRWKARGAAESGWAMSMFKAILGCRIHDDPVATSVKGEIKD